MNDIEAVARAICCPYGCAHEAGQRKTCVAVSAWSNEAHAALTALGWRKVGPDEVAAIRNAALEEAAGAITAYKRDASFDDSAVGALEHNSNVRNLAAVIQDMIAAATAPASQAPDDCSGECPEHPEPLPPETSA